MAGPKADCYERHKRMEALHSAKMILEQGLAKWAPSGSKRDGMECGRNRTVRYNTPHFALCCHMHSIDRYRVTTYCTGYGGPTAQLLAGCR